MLKKVVINAHIINAKKGNELVDVPDAHNELLGIGLDDIQPSKDMEVHSK